MHIRSIIIPAVGSGTHLLPATRVVPAEHLTVYDRPVLQFAIDEAIGAGAERIIVVIHPDKLSIRDYLKPDETGVGRLGAGGRATRAAAAAAAAAVQVPGAVDPMIFATLRGLPQDAAPAGWLTDAIAEDAALVPLTAFRFHGRRHDCASPDGLIEAGLARQRAVKRARSPTTGTARLTARINDWPAAARRIDARTAALEGIAP